MFKTPHIAPTAFVAHNATVAGDVTLGEQVSVFFGAVLRAEHDTITVGDGTNVQDCCVFHCDEGYPVSVGKNCTIGHGAIIHGCTIGDNTLIGMGAIVLNGAKIGDNCIIGAGALVTGGTVIPDGSLVVGSPAKVKRPVTEAEIESNRASAAGYRTEGAEYKEWEAQQK